MLARTKRTNNQMMLSSKTVKRIEKENRKGRIIRIVNKYKIMSKMWMNKIKSKRK
jgi:uncharacterized ubiquitin-like protein YukD